MTRTYINHTIEQLEYEFANKKHLPKLLEAIHSELGYRSTQRAKKLMAELIEFQKSQSQTNKIPDDSPKIQATIPPVRMNTEPLPISKERSENIISAWTCLEVLSPQTFIKPENLAQNGDPNLVSSFKSGRLPWEGLGEKSKPNYQLFYHVIIGTLKIDESYKMLLKVYNDKSEEKASRKGEAVLASVLVNSKGYLIEAPAASISSFAWALPYAKNGQLPILGNWANIEQKLHEEFEEILRRKDVDETELPLDLGIISKAYNWLVGKLELPQEVIKPNQFAVKYFHYYKSGGSPEALLLNSFYLNDLSAAKKLISTKKSTQNLKKYLGESDPEKNINLLEDSLALDKIIAPANMPLARWPGRGRHPLVLLQQAAVNLTFQNLKTDGILPVNGPPGTGKTTLLRDIIAGILAQRADAMCGFQDPKLAFQPTGQKINVGQGWLHFYELDSRLKGFEMLIASSNNKAVENVSAELPTLSAVSDEYPDLRYFKSTSDALHKKETWGLIAAVLGNGRNKNIFQQTFWWDKDFGMRTYLAEASGTPQWIEETDSLTGEITRTRPKILALENAPPNPETALLNWKKIRHDYISLQQESKEKLDLLEKVREIVLSLPEIKANIQREQKDLYHLAIALKDAQRKHEPLAEEIAANKIEERQVEGQRSLHLQSRPGFFARLFGTAEYKVWKKKDLSLLSELSTILTNLHRLTKESHRQEKEIAEWKKKNQTTEKSLNEFKSKLEAAREKIDQAGKTIGNHLIGEIFWSQKPEIIHMISPWCNDQVQGMRDRMFVAAMAVHKAFIDASASKFRHNLSLMMMVLSGKKMQDKEKKMLIPDLWSSLFMVVPAISTTFASIERMLGDIPAESLGWLLVDEAGQAVPQYAIGAIMRTKKAVIVGDPIQIEPVVSLPEIMTKSICEYFKVDADRFNAPGASVQTLSDETSVYNAEFSGGDGIRKVGIPLLVHRRCTEPMFTISNSIAYSGKMVQAKHKGSSPIRDLMGGSHWFDIKGRSQDKWSQKEGEQTLQILQKIKGAGIKPDLYIISPFLIVAENLRKLIENSGILNGWVENPYLWLKDRIGTVHTVQGREAEAVIFVLGAPSPEQIGARKWAGSSPNILNVAVTRAKEAIYVIGDKTLWNSAGLFSELALRLATNSQ